MHGPGHKSEERKVLKVYPENYAEQRPHKDKEACSSGKTKPGKSVNFDNNKQEVNIMEYHDDPIPKKIRGKN